MLKKLNSRLKLARKSLGVWLMAGGLALAEVLPVVMDSMPLAQEAFDSDTYRYMLKGLFVVGLVLRVIKLKPSDHTSEQKGARDAG